MSADQSRVEIERRLAELREEFHKAEAMLSQLEREAQRLRDQQLRLAGAIEVLDDLLATPPS